MFVMMKPSNNFVELYVCYSDVMQCQQ